MMKIRISDIFPTITPETKLKSTKSHAAEQKEMLVQLLHQLSLRLKPNRYFELTLKVQDGIIKHVRFSDAIETLEQMLELNQDRE